ncbi:MAG TPA: recombinase family protein [Paracoccaceae bacterium]|nr:recombinase family protein [Paracoccaceae bacterium]
MAGREPPSGREPANSSPKRRAAEYVRMSTDHQKYSTENQSDAIRRYAEERGFELVRSYADAGKSGLRIEGREALQQLIQDVKAERPFARTGLSCALRWRRSEGSEVVRDSRPDLKPGHPAIEVAGHDALSQELQATHFRLDQARRWQLVHRFQFVRPRRREPQSAPLREPICVDRPEG